MNFCETQKISKKDLNIIKLCGTGHQKEEQHLNIWYFSFCVIFGHFTVSGSYVFNLIKYVTILQWIIRTNVLIVTPINRNIR